MSAFVFCCLAIANVRGTKCELPVQLSQGMNLAVNTSWWMQS